MFYSAFSVGWIFSNRHWKHYEMMYLILAGMATPLVFSVHTIVSFDFAVSVLPGWHTTIFPPYFVAGAIYAGFAMVLTLTIPLRAFWGLRDMITMKHLDVMAKVMFATGIIVGYGYLMEGFTAWYSANNWEQFVLRVNRSGGPYGLLYGLLLLTNSVIPQLLCKRSIRTNTIALRLEAMSVNVGMWLQRFI